VRRFDVAIVDVSMPGESGLELVQHLRLRHPDMASVMVSGSEETAHIERVGEYSELVARRLGLSEDRCRLVSLAAPMHEVGRSASQTRSF
jgi:response regulator RpfG family c-di-GMP phosphodiesterase